MQRAFRKKESPAAANGGAYQDCADTNSSRAARRRQAAAKAPPILSRADRQTLSRLAALAGRHLDLLLDGAGREEVLRSGFDLTEELTARLRRVAPERFGREAGARP